MKIPPSPTFEQLAQTKTSINSHSYRRWMSHMTYEFVIEIFNKKRKMKHQLQIFQTVQRQYAILGISSSHQSNRKYPFSERVLFGFLLFGCNIVSHAVYIFHVADGFMEYVECICVTSGSILIYIGFAAIVLGQTAIFETIDKIGKLIDTSEPVL